MVFWCHLGNAVEKNGGDPISPVRYWRKDCTACLKERISSAKRNFFPSTLMHSEIQLHTILAFLSAKGLTVGHFLKGLSHPEKQTGSYKSNFPL